MEQARGGVKVTPPMDFQFRDSQWPCMLYYRHLVYIATIVSTFYGDIIWVWVCQMGKNMGAMTTREK